MEYGNFKFEFKRTKFYMEAPGNERKLWNRFKKISSKRLGRRNLVTDLNLHKDSKKLWTRRFNAFDRVIKTKEEEKIRKTYSFSIAKNGSRRDKLWRRVEEDRKKLTLWPPSQRAIESISVGSGPSKRSIVHSVTERFGSMEDLMSRIPTLFRVTLTGLDPGYKDRAKGENLFLFRASEVRRLATETFSAILWFIFEMIERGAYDWTR